MSWRDAGCFFGASWPLPLASTTPTPNSKANWVLITTQLLTTRSCFRFFFCALLCYWGQRRKLYVDLPFPKHSSLWEHSCEQHHVALGQVRPLVHIAQWLEVALRGSFSSPATWYPLDVSLSLESSPCRAGAPALRYMLLMDIQDATSIQTVQPGKPREFPGLDLSLAIWLVGSFLNILWFIPLRYFSISQQ